MWTIDWLYVQISWEIPLTWSVVVKYARVYALLILWEDEDPQLPVSLEVHELGVVLASIYKYEVQIYRIPSGGSHKRLNQKILDFVELGGDNKEDLKIVYFGGHGMLAQIGSLVGWGKSSINIFYETLLSFNLAHTGFPKIFIFENVLVFEKLRFRPVCPIVWMTFRQWELLLSWNQTKYRTVLRHCYHSGTWTCLVHWISAGGFS